MLTYDIKQNGFKIGIAYGRHKAFEFIQKEVERCGLLGYWKGDKYLCDNNQYEIERGSNE